MIGLSQHPLCKWFPSKKSGLHQDSQHIHRIYRQSAGTVSENFHSNQMYARNLEVSRVPRRRIIAFPRITSFHLINVCLRKTFTSCSRGIQDILLVGSPQEEIVVIPPHETSILRRLQANNEGHHGLDRSGIREKLGEQLPAEFFSDSH